MTPLELVEVATGEVLDTVTLDGGELRYATGVAEAIVEGRRGRFGWAAEEACDRLAGWSNGYVLLRRRDGGDQGGQDAGQQS